MSDDPFERAARKLAAAIHRRLRDAGVASPDAVASDLMHVVRGHGWRPVEALQPPAASPSSGGGKALPEEFREQRAALDNRPPCTCGRPVLEHQLVCGKRAACPATGCTAYTPAPERS